jgi:hypothetical protein
MLYSQFMKTWPIWPVHGDKQKNGPQQLAAYISIEAIHAALSDGLFEKAEEGLVEAGLLQQKKNLKQLKDPPRRSQPDGTPVLSRYVPV